MPAGANQGHVELPHGEEISLYNSDATQKMLAKKSVIKTTQEDQVKSVFVVVSCLLNEVRYRK